MPEDYAFVYAANGGWLYLVDEGGVDADGGVSYRYTAHRFGSWRAAFNAAFREVSIRRMSRRPHD